MTNSPEPKSSSAKSEPWVASVLRETLALKAASVVIFRPKIIVEFKTEELGRGLQYFTQDGHETWQIGEFTSHHFHVDLDSINEVVFNAEPVSCQGGRLNYTVWFMVDWDCDNPYRKGGYFSVTLNSPYNADGSANREVIDPVIALYKRFNNDERVIADAGFLKAITQELAMEV